MYLLVGPTPQPLNSTGPHMLHFAPQQQKQPWKLKKKKIIKKKFFKGISESKEEVIEFRNQNPKKKKTLSFFEISVFQKQRKHFSSLSISLWGERV